MFSDATELRKDGAYSGSMKKSEALNILGLADGATGDAVKQAHRKLVIAHHPDKFALGSKERDDAEEFTKRINEARDVLLDRSWTPEFDPRRDPRPYANNPYARPAQHSSSGPAQQGQDPFAGWPFGQTPGQGQTTYVWTSWDAAQPGSGAPGGQPFDPFDPFAPFRASTEPRKTPQEALDEVKRDLGREVLMMAIKAALLAVSALMGTVATGLFLYVMVSIVYGLWKRFGSCLIGIIVPLALIGAPLVFIIAPRQGAVTAGLAVAFLFAVLFDLVNIRNLMRTLRVARRVAS